MARSSDELQKHTLNLRRGDWDTLASYYPDLPTASIVRRIVSKFVEQIEAKGEAGLNAKVEIKL